MTEVKPTSSTVQGAGRPTLGTARATAEQSPRDRLFSALEHAFPSWSLRHSLINALADFVDRPDRFPHPGATVETNKGKDDE